jgi:aerobic C4-dicarboxylate transport protein
MSEARALTNLVGNGVATIVVGKWCGDLDQARMLQVLNNEATEDVEGPERIPDFGTRVPAGAS